MSETASFTCDLEPDCPPYLWGFRGMEEGLPKLLDMLRAVGVRGTFFTTGDVAQRYPASIRDLLADGHELGCHGMTHTSFTELSASAAEQEIVESATILRRFAAVTSFRAPYLKFPDHFLPILEREGFLVDSSQAKYKGAYYTSQARTSLVRIPASLTSSALRLPRLLRAAYLRGLSMPIVMFVHPWEFVDLRHERLRWDCRFRTGDTALGCVQDVLRGMIDRGTRFIPVNELALAGGSPHRR